jgi:GNAT superfamily N-acetyltransferase
MSELHTTHLVLREFRDSDVDPLYEIQGNPDYMRFTFCAESRAACESWLRRYADIGRMNGFAPWTIVNRSDNRVIGWGGLNIDPKAPEWGIEVSYFIHPAYQGRGFATELVPVLYGMVLMILVSDRSRHSRGPRTRLPFAFSRSASLNSFAMNAFCSVTITSCVQKTGRAMDIKVSLERPDSIEVLNLFDETHRELKARYSAVPSNTRSTHTISLRLRPYS